MQTVQEWGGRVRGEEDATTASAGHSRAEKSRTASKKGFHCTGRAGGHVRAAQTAWKKEVPAKGTRGKHTLFSKRLDGGSDSAFGGK